MKLKNLKKQDGFTIIEVLIVLAIAGLIMLVVFLAVPALQRNSRNTQRTNDASLIAASVNECLANRNGQIDECDQIIEGPNLPADEQEIPLAADKLSQLTDLYSGVMTNNRAPSGVQGSDPLWGTVEDENNHFYVSYGAECNASGDGVQDGSNRQFVVVYRYETSDGDAVRCLGS